MQGFTTKYYLCEAERGDFIYFTEEQKERANAVHIADILRREHEEVCLLYTSRCV